MMPLDDRTGRGRPQIFSREDERTRQAMRAIEEDNRWLQNLGRRISRNLLRRLPCKPPRKS
jgi:type II secretory pathway component PulJ